MENILGGTEMKRKIISIMLSIAIVITGIQLPVIKKAVLAKENVLNKFDAYYTAHSDNVPQSAPDISVSQSVLPSVFAPLLDFCHGI